MTNTETLPHNPILFLGGLSEIGTPLIERLTLAGYQVIAGTTSNAKLLAVQERLSVADRVRPRGFVADLTNSDQIEETYNALNLESNTPVHLLLWSVASMSLAMRMAIGKEVASAYKPNGKTIDEATQGIKAIVTAYKALDDLMRVNTGILHIVHLLRRDGHITKDSVVSTLSSSGSDALNPNDPDSYPGPWLYYPIAYPKQSLVLSLQEEAQEAGFRYINFVAPLVEDTPIVNWFGKLIARLKERYPGMVFDFPSITKADLVTTLSNRLMYGENGEQIESVYIKGLNKVSPARPPEWNKQYPF